MLNAFKIVPFDLEPIYAEWKNPPRFSGNSKKDLPVDDWLQEIKAGCIERKVPREYWHKVAQHYLADKAKVRFDELKLVMKNMHGGKYRWTWKNFKIAMRNMGCEYCGAFSCALRTALTHVLWVQGTSTRRRLRRSKWSVGPRASTLR